MKMNKKKRIFKISQSSYEGDVILPSSKSLAARYLFCSIFSQQVCSIKGSGYSSDIQSCFNALKVFRPESEIKALNNHFFEIAVKGKSLFDNTYQMAIHEPIKIDCKESAFCIRAISPICSLSDKSFLLTGADSLLSRPMDMIEQALVQLGASIRFIKKSRSNCYDIFIKGPIKKQKVTIDCSKTSQLVSGAMIALASLKEDSYIICENLTSFPYIKLTKKVLEDFGIFCEFCAIKDNLNIKKRGKIVEIKGSQVFKPVDEFIEGDWSAASFFLLAGAIRGNLNFKNLSYPSSQPDSIFLEILKQAGATVSIQNIADGINIEGYKTFQNISIKNNQLKSFDFDFNDYPDIFIPSIILASFCEGTSKFYGTGRLVYKESDRLNNMIYILNELFKNITVQNGIVYIKGTKNNLNKLSSNFLETGDKFNFYFDPANDHRILMALFILAGLSKTPFFILDDGSYKKSNPQFLENFTSAGGKYEEIYE